MTFNKNANKNLQLFLEQSEKYDELYKSRNIKTVFPNGYSVYTKDLVIQYIKEKIWYGQRK